MCKTSEASRVMYLCSARSRREACLRQLSLLCFGVVADVLGKDIAFGAKKQFSFFVCICGRRSNDLKFRSGLPISTNSEMWIGLRWQQAAKCSGGWGLESCSKTLLRTRGLHRAGAPCLEFRLWSSTCRATQFWLLVCASNLLVSNC